MVCFKKYFELFTFLLNYYACFYVMYSEMPKSVVVIAIRTIVILSEAMYSHFVKFTKTTYLMVASLS